MTNVNSSAVRHALNQTTAAREAIGYFIQRILQQFNNVNQMLSAIIKNAEPYDREQRERAIWEER